VNSLVSCIVPAYNSERFIAEALDSILAQTWRPIEVIVADDGSEDGTLEVVGRYGSAVRVVSQATAGPSTTRNLGLTAATGDFIAFLDADDLWHPEKLSIQMARFEERPDLDISVTHARHFWDDELADEKERLRDHPRSQVIPGYATTTLLAPRAVFRRVGELDPDLWFSDAAEWFVRAEEMGCVRELLADVLVYHRMHRGNISRRARERSRQEWLNLVKARLDRRRQADAAPSNDPTVE